MFGKNNKLDIDWLRTVSAFEGFTDENLTEIAEVGQRVEAEVGAELTDQGRYGDVAYVIVDGTANVLMNGEYVAAVGAGTMVGEMALLEHRPRTASVVAETDMTLVAFGVKEFREILDRNPNAKERVLRLLNTRAKANHNRKEH